MDDQFDVQVPLRVDLSGGWTDVNPYCTDFGGEVVNFTINKYVKAKIDNSGKIHYQFDVPAGSGLGASGSLNVARIALMKKEDNFSLNEIAEAAYQAEIDSEIDVVGRTNGLQHLEVLIALCSMVKMLR